MRLLYFLAAFTVLASPCYAGNRVTDLTEALLAAGIPIIGIRGGTTDNPNAYTIQYASSATAGQIAQAESIAAGWDWTPIPKPRYTAFVNACYQDPAIMPQHIQLIPLIADRSLRAAARKTVWAKVRNIDLPAAAASGRNASLAAIEAHAVAANMPLTP
jgi:hypothetical protein